MIDTSRSVQNYVAANPGSGVDDGAGHNNRSLPNTGVLRNDGRRVNQVRKRKPARQCLLRDTYSAMAITECNNGLRHVPAQRRQHIEVSQNRGPAKQGPALLSSVVQKADYLQSSTSGNF